MCHGAHTSGTGHLVRHKGGCGPRVAQNTQQGPPGRNVAGVQQVGNRNKSNGPATYSTGLPDSVCLSRRLLENPSQWPSKRVFNRIRFPLSWRACCGKSATTRSGANIGGMPPTYSVSAAVLVPVAQASKDRNWFRRRGLRGRSARQSRTCALPLVRPRQ
jgi:hypothetical protein